MKKYIVAVILGLMLFPVVSYAKCCDCCRDEDPVMYKLPLSGTTTAISRYSYDGKGYVISIKTFRDTGIEKLIGKVVHRTKPCVIGNLTDRSYINEPRKLLAVTNEYLILSSDILASGKFEIERDEWDDGNWEEVKPQRLTVNEMIGTETFHTINYGESDYNCVRCGKTLKIVPGNSNYYCASCKTGFNIKEE